MIESDDRTNDQGPMFWAGAFYDLVFGPIGPRRNRNRTERREAGRRLIAWQAFRTSPGRLLMAAPIPILALTILVALHARGWLPGLVHAHDAAVNALHFLFFLLWNLVLLSALTGALAVMLLSGNGTPIRIAQLCVLVALCGVVYYGLTRVARESMALTPPPPTAPPVSAVKAPPPRDFDRLRNGEALTVESASARADRAAALAREKWRADLETAGAFGPPGEIPPMLRVTETGDTIDVTNRTKAPLCVRVARVRLESTGLQRCVIENVTCRDLAAGASHRFRRFRSDDSPACTAGKLEFRIGTFEKPDPTWWTRTALDDYDATRKP